MSKQILKLALSKLSNASEFEPRKYFLNSLLWMLTKPACGLALAPGLGKTLITLLALKILSDEGHVGKTLILAKRRIIRKVWPDERAKWGIDLSLAVVHGTPAKKRKLLSEDHDVYLMTYESLFWLYQQDPKLYRQFDALVCDESSKVKGWSAKRSKLLRQHLHEFTRRYCLTGSLQPNTEMDLFMPTYVLDLGERLGRFITAFRNRWFYPSGYEGHDWKLQDGGADEIAEIISDVWLRYGEEELDLPPLVKVVREVELSDRARRVYDELETEFMSELDAGIIVAPNSGVASGKMRQLTGGAIYTRPAADGENRSTRPWEQVDDEKLAELEELVDSLAGLPLLVAYEFDHERQRIQAHFKKLGLDVPAIGGGTKDADADRYIDEWNRGELPVLLGQPDSIAHGLNMQGAEAYVCFYSIGWNFENHDQFIKRVHRSGQRHRVIVYYLVARDTVDADVVENLDLKGSKQAALYAALQARFRKAKKEPLTMATKKAAPKKKAAAKTKPKAKAAPAAAEPKAKATRLRLKPDAMITRGATPAPDDSAYAKLVACIPKGRRASLESLSKTHAKRLKQDHNYGFTRSYVMRAIKQGYLAVAA